MVPLVPPSLRTAVRPLLWGAGGVFVLLAALVWHGHAPLAVDTSVQHALGVPSWTQRLHQHLGDQAENLGSAPVVGLMSVALAVAAWVRRRHDLRSVILCAIAFPVGDAVELVLKPLIGRRYYGSAYRFPSGHEAVIVALALVAWMVLAPTVTRRTRWAIGLMGAAVVVVVTWGTLVTRSHSPIDVVGGLALGAGAALGAAAALDALALRSRSRSSVGVSR
jgi:hypothetical protein